MVDNPVSPPAGVPERPPTTEPSLPPAPPGEILAVSSKKSRSKIILAALSLLIILASLPVAVYLVKQRQELRKRAVGEPCLYCENCEGSSQKTHQCHGTIQDGGCKYDPNVNPNCTSCKLCGNGTCDVCEGPDWCPQDCGGEGDCQPAKEYSGAVTPGYDCARGGSASVTVTACLPEACPRNGATVSYSRTIAHCSGESWANCEGACGAGATSATVTIPIGQRCASATISCNPPGNCGSCQVDIDGYGVRRWENSGCERPTSTPTPTLTPTPTPGPLKCVSLGGELDPSSLSPGDEVTLTCTGSSDPTVPIDHFEFRVSADSGTPVVQPSVPATKTNGEYEGATTYEIPDYGCYKVECRACTSSDSSECTAWGQAQ